jgi:hypothetical protein
MERNRRMIIIDYVDRIGPERNFTNEEIERINEHVSNLIKKFGIVFDIASYRTNKSSEDDKD